MATKKLIEVALPLEKINLEAEKEKQIRHAHPSNLHQYWARRPFTTARAVIWASLVDDPSSHPDLFPTEEDQNRERNRLFKVLESLVEWENSNDEFILKQAKKEIIKSTNNNPPALLDPFCGGGAIPFEAQRLGLETHAHDLNPIAVMINKVMIEFPALFPNSSPVNPRSRKLFQTQWEGITGHAEDVQYYGERINEEAKRIVGSNYPKVKLSKELGGGCANVISWIWTRTVKCPNPACGCEVPLAKSFDISTKKGNLHHVEVKYIDKKLSFIVKPGKSDQKGTMSRKGAICLCCGNPIDMTYIRNEASSGRMYERMMATVAEGKGKRVYLTPDREQIDAAKVNKPIEYPVGEIAYNPRDIRTQLYGLYDYSDLFTNRQLNTLSIMAKLIDTIRKEVERDAITAGMNDDHISIENCGVGAFAYSQVIAVHLAFLLDKMACLHSNLTMWKPLAQCPLSFFGRQAIPMAWDFAEANPFSGSSGSYNVILSGYVKALVASLDVSIEKKSYVKQFDAQMDCGLRNIMISTDPPYYDNISYADLSDFFYVWMRYSLRTVFPDIFRTILVPKKEELVATPYHFDGDSDVAKEFFESGMFETCRQLNLYAREDIPVTIYYAYKQSSIDENSEVASTGWETMLSAIIRAGFSITGTWPIRTERAARNVSLGANALASSIVLVCRKRDKSAPQITRRNLVNILRKELRPALKQLRDSNIAPVDLAQSSIGPGMAVFSRYRQVLEADGSPMTVRSALQVINEEIDLYFNEQVGEMDSSSRFCVDLYTQNAFNDIKYGDAEILATAKSTSIPMMSSRGMLYAKAGIVHLLERSELPERVDCDEKCVWMLTQQLTQAMTKGGVEACAQIVANMFGSNAEQAKDLAYRLYTIAEQKNWADEAYAYNSLVVAWPDIQSRAAALKAVEPKQMTLFDYDTKE